jgi:thioredoxin-dependent peroxiredoxin
MSKQFPSFSLMDQNNKQWTNADIKGKWALFFIYPKDSTPGCTVENRDFSDRLLAFEELSCKVFGVSPDPVEQHTAFCQNEQLKHTLLSDPEKKLLIPLEAWGEKMNYGKVYTGVIRSTFLVSPEGEIVKAWRNVKATGHAERVLDTTRLMCKRSEPS